jgi:hypothetical protein
MDNEMILAKYYGRVKLAEVLRDAMELTPREHIYATRLYNTMRATYMSMSDKATRGEAL